MQYVWYIDTYLLINFGMDLLLLILLRKLLKQPVSGKYLLAGAGIGAVGSCISVWLWRYPLILSNGVVGLLSVSVMLWIPFRPKTLRSFVKTLLLFFMEIFCIGGILEVIYQHSSAGYVLAWMLQGNMTDKLPVLTVLFACAGSWFAFRFLWLNLTELRKEQRMQYNVCLTVGDKQIRTTGYWDTGNCLQEPERGLPVHIVSEILWNRLKTPESTTVSIPYHTIGNPCGMMEGMQIDRLEIEEETGEKRILFGVWIARAPFRLTKEGSYEILLHRETFNGIDQMEGW